MTTLNQLFTELHIGTTLRSIILILIGVFVARLLSAGFTKLLNHRLTRHHLMIVNRVTFYLILFIFVISVVDELGFHIGAILGATGILTIAIGIASQTSLSNIVSGIFIIAEKPFEIGDTIKVNELQGEVISIDWLSVKIRTMDNTLVRLPNETLIKSSVINLSYFPVRRVDVAIGVDYKEDLNHVKEVLFDVAEKSTYCLREPEPLFLVLGFGDSAVNIQFSVWIKNEKYNEMKTQVQIEIKKAFDEYQIGMPYPCRTIYTVNSTEKK